MDILEHRILSSTARSECRQRIMAHVAGLSQQVNRSLEGFAQFAAEIQEELLMNALWDANPKMSSADRRTPIQLAEHEAVTTQWGFDGEIFYFSVRDPFGTFAGASLDKYKRFIFCSDKINAVRVQQDGAGAGIGLYMVIERLSGMIVTVKPGVATEIVAMLRLGQSPRFVAKRDKSFQHFCI